MPWVRCAFGNVSRPILRPNCFETAIETLYETKSFQIVTFISLENDISTARTLRVIDCTLTFYLEICEIPRLFWDHYRDFFWDQIFRDQYWDFFETQIWDPYRDFLWDQLFSRLRLFLRLKFFETDTETFLRPIPIPSKKWEKSRYREVSRQDVTLCVGGRWHQNWAHTSPQHFY